MWIKAIVKLISSFTESDNHIGKYAMNTIKHTTTISIKPDHITELEYFNPDIDGLNNLTIKVTNNMVTIIAYDDQCNEILIKAMPFYQLLESATNKHNNKKAVFKKLFNRD